VAFTLAGTQEWFLIAVVIWRTLLFVLLTFELGSIALSKEPGRRWRIGYLVAAFLLLISAVIIGWNAVDGYAASRSTDNPLQPVVQRLQEESTSDSGLICRDIVVCEQIAPFISGLDTHWLPSPSNWQADFLPEFTQEHSLLWLVEVGQDAGHDLTVERYLSKRYGKVSQEWLGAARVSRFVALDLPPTWTVDATFGCCLRLNSYAVHAEGTFIHVELNWESTSPMETSYKVFVHALNADGELIAQNDQYPVGGFKPTDQWMVSIPVQDRHGLLLPAPYQPDTILRAGLYDPVTGERLPVSESGMTFVELFLE
jgi:hypothetical protein